MGGMVEVGQKVLRSRDLQTPELGIRSRVARADQPPSRGFRVLRGGGALMPLIAQHFNMERRNPVKPALIIRYPVRKVHQAYRRCRWLKEWEKLYGEPWEMTKTDAAERIVAQAKGVESDDFPISVRTLQLWRARYYAIGDDRSIRGVEGLIDRRGNKPKGGEAYERRSQEAIDYFYGLYHAPQRFTMKTCHEMTCAKAVQNAWMWPASYAATSRWLREYGTKVRTAPQSRRDDNSTPGSTFGESEPRSVEMEFFDP